MAEDCRGQTAVLCPRASDSAAPDFCTRQCFNLGPEECGADARCVAQGNGQNLCMPSKCAAALERKVAPTFSLRKGCTAAEPNALGVGKACATHADCASQTGARFCPRAMNPRAPAWCSMLCNADAECGDGAFCWTRMTIERGVRRPVSSCAPVICRVPADSPEAVPEPPASATSTWGEGEREGEGEANRAQLDPAQDPGNANNPANKCEPGQINDKGVGKPCKTRDDCTGLWANFCDISISPRRPPMCSRMCDDHTDCGPNAMCGVVNGVRHCYPKVCEKWKYSKGCEETNPFCKEGHKPPPRSKEEGEAIEKAEEEGRDLRLHKGAAICSAGVAFGSDGFGKRCDKSSYARHGETCRGQFARACEATFNPDGPDYCLRECEADSTCGDQGYCGYHEPLHNYTICFPRCPEPQHMSLRKQPAQLDLCNAENGTVPRGTNEFGVGMRCNADAQCAGNQGAKTCGLSLATSRKPDVCTKSCQNDAECGHNALCVDPDFGVTGPGKAGEKGKFCLPACWSK